MATLTLRRAAITCSRGPKGMKAWQLLLDWLTPVERARLTRAAVRLCRAIQWARTVARNTETLRCLYEYKIYDYEIGGLGCILIVPHHYMPDSSP